MNAREIIESEDEFFAADFLPRKNYVKNKAEAKTLPVGTRVRFNRFAAQCYSTVYWRVATYAVTPLKRGPGNYLKLIDTGYGTYPHLGGKYDEKEQGRIIWPN